MDTTASSREPASREAEPDQLHDPERARIDLNSSIQHDRGSHRRLENGAPGDGAQGVGAGGKDDAADGCVGECTGQSGAAAHRPYRRHSKTAVGAVGAEGAVAPLRSGSTIVAFTIGGKVTHLRAGLCAGEAHHHGEEDYAGESRRGPKAARRAAPSRESACKRGDDPDAMMLIEPLISTCGGCCGSENTCQPVQTMLPAAGDHGRPSLVCRSWPCGRPRAARPHSQVLTFFDAV